MGIKQLLFLCFFAITTSLSAQAVTEHVVVKGNTLYSLSKQYGITVNALLEANPQIAGTTLSLDDVLIIPMPERKDSVLAPTVDPVVNIQDSAHSEAKYDMYKVRRGDTPEDLGAGVGFSRYGLFLPP